MYFNLFLREKSFVLLWGIWETRLAFFLERFAFFYEFA